MEKIKKILKEDGVYFLIYIIFAIFTVTLLYNVNYNMKIEYTVISQNDYITISTFFIIIISMIYLFLFRNVDKKEINKEKIFLMISIPIGLLYMILIPIAKTPDEMSHFYRAYEVSRGFLVSDQNEDNLGGRTLPSELIKLNYTPEDNVKTWFERVSTAEITDSKIYIAFSNTALYSFVCYIPQAIGMFLVQLFTKRIIFIAYAGRLVNLIFFITIMYYALKKMPFKKLAFFIIAFLPIVFQEAASLSPDALTIAIATYLVAYVLDLKYTNKEMFTKKNFFVLATITIILALCKIIYIPMCLILYMIPNEKFKNKKTKYMVLSSIIIIAFIINLSWLAFSSRYLVEFNPNVNSKEQVINVLSNPFNYMFTVIKTLEVKFSDYMHNILGNALCLLNVSNSLIYRNLLMLLLLFSIFCDNNEEKKVDNFSKIIIGISVVLVLGLLCTSLYVQWTPLKQEFIDGIQGRYFIPILILLPILFNNDYIISNKKISYRYVFLFMMFINIHSLTYMINSIL